MHALYPGIWRGLATVGQYVLPSIFTLGALLSLWRRLRRADAPDRGTRNDALTTLSAISWQEFEDRVGDAFARRGYDVRRIGNAGGDGGIDLELRRHGELHLVQCKHWRAYRVGVDVVRDLYGAMAASGAASGYLVTSGRFTKQAAAFAAGRNMTLIDGDALPALLQPSDLRNSCAARFSRPASDRRAR